MVRKSLQEEFRDIGLQRKRVSSYMIANPSRLTHILYFVDPTTGRGRESRKTCENMLTKM